MKTIKALLILVGLLGLSGCATKDDGFYFGPLTIEGSQFETTQAPIYKTVVETSLDPLHCNCLQFEDNDECRHVFALETLEEADEMKGGKTRGKAK